MSLSVCTGWGVLAGALITGAEGRQQQGLHGAAVRATPRHSRAAGMQTAAKAPTWEMPLEQSSQCCAGACGAATGRAVQFWGWFRGIFLGCHWATAAWEVWQSCSGPCSAPSHCAGAGVRPDLTTVPGWYGRSEQEPERAHGPAPRGPSVLQARGDSSPLPGDCWAKQAASCLPRSCLCACAAHAWLALCRWPHHPRLCLHS